MSSSTATARGRGKLIVFGEHAVVYGRPAVACSLDGGVTARLSRAGSPSFQMKTINGPLSVDDRVRKAADRLFSTFELDPEQLAIDVDVDIPLGAGLGSSAAMATAMARAAADLRGLDGTRRRDAVDDAVAASEAVFHGTPSGIDQRAAIGEGFFTFDKSNEGTPFNALDVPAHTWLVAKVAPSSSTAAMVESVRQLRDRHPELIEELLDNFAAVAERGARALSAGDWATVGELMNVNQGLLNAIGVSTDALETACHAVRNAGAYGAKLTGAGGGGCVVALPPADGIDTVQDALGDCGDVYRFQLPAR